MTVTLETLSDQIGDAVQTHNRPSGRPRTAAQESFLKDKIHALRTERKAIILAHNYQEGSIQDIADFTGDSLGLALKAKETDAKVIVFCGVHFMAETAKMTNPQKTVLMPSLEAGCSLADMVTAKGIRDWRKDYPDGLVVCYVNTSAAVKAESDYCVTSTNGVKVLNHLPADKDILFVPDFYLGGYLKAKTKRKIHLWKGYCPSHAAIIPEKIDRALDAYPNAEFLLHPECGCTTKYMDMADEVLSTEGMVQHVKRSESKEFIIATEIGLLHRLEQLFPDKTFIPGSEYASCHHMKRNTLENLFLSLLHLRYEITVDPEIAERARKPIERMFEIV